MFDLNKAAEKFGLPPAGNNGRKWLLPTVIAVIFILVLLVAGNALVFFELSHVDRFFPGSKIGSINLSGLTKDEAFKVLDEAAAKVDQQQVQVEYEIGGKKEVFLLDQVLTADSATDFLEYDVYKTVYDNYSIGRTGNWLNKLSDQWRLWFGSIKNVAYFRLNSDYLHKILESQLKSLESDQINAAPLVSCAGQSCQISVSEEKAGLLFDFDSALAAWSDDLAQLDEQPIRLRQVVAKPVIKKDQVIGLVGKVQELFNSSSTPRYIYQEKNWQLSKAELSKIIDFEQGDAAIYLSIDKSKFNDWFANNVSKEIDKPAVNATIQVVEGKVVSLSSHKSGQAADMEKAYFDLKAKIINQDFTNLNFAVSVVSTTPDVETANINDLGITEIIGVGESDFSGSPTNRRKNIKNGAEKLQGKLIAPGEQFSLIKALLPVDASTGYFPELVIKGNKTMPEYGGGLCQIGTTVFRAALASGLPIIERQNHSYSVGYYLENGLPGVDATIYDPKPDLIFRNDTANYILIQTRIAGDKLYFEFWGTKDGRLAERTKPKTWGIKEPAPAKLIETLDLPPGEKKCTEKAHKGISAAFDYIVKYPDGRTATSTFTSVYKPWQEVCLIGVSSLTAASSTAVKQ